MQRLCAYTQTNIESHRTRPLKLATALSMGECIKRAPHQKSVAVLCESRTRRLMNICAASQHTTTIVSQDLQSNRGGPMPASCNDHIHVNPNRRPSARRLHCCWSPSCIFAPFLKQVILFRGWLPQATEGNGVSDDTARKETTYTV